MVSLDEDMLAAPAKLVAVIDGKEVKWDFRPLELTEQKPRQATWRISGRSGKLDISGTLNGQLTIAAEGDIHVVGDVLYNTNPVDYDGDGLVNVGNNNGINDPAHGNAPADDTDDDNDGIPDDEDDPVPLGTDKLGLVAEGNVIVDDDGTYEQVDRTICATIMALDTSFTVEDYSGHVEGTLTIIGGLIQNQPEVPDPGYSRRTPFSGRGPYLSGCSLGEN